ncbi:hypothetical protein Tco_0828241 [Tanacetum coccineum]
MFVSAIGGPCGKMGKHRCKESASIVRNCNSFSSVADCSLTFFASYADWPDGNWEELPIEFCEDGVDGFKDDD